MDTAKTLGASLVTLGALCIVVAITGGPVKALASRFPAVESTPLRVLLGLVSIAFVSLGIVFWFTLPATERVSSTTSNTTTKPSPSSSDVLIDSAKEPPPQQNKTPPTYNTALNQACERYLRKREEMPPLVPDDDKSLANSTLQAASLLRELSTAASQLSPPDSLTNSHESFLLAVRGLASEFDGMSSAANTGDVDTYNYHQRASQTYTQRISTYATELNSRECQQVSAS